MKKTTYVETLMHCVKGMLGAGIFSMGVAFKTAGMAVALVAGPLIAIMVLHCVHMLIEAIEVANKHYEKELEAKKARSNETEEDNKELNEESHALSYAIVVEILLNESQFKIMSKFAGTLYVLIQITICTMYLGFCSLYVVFVGTNMSEVLESLDTQQIEKKHLMMIFAIPMWILSMIPNLKALASVSIVANILLMTSFGISYYYIFGEISSTKEFNISYVGDLDQIPLFFGVALFSFEMVALIFPLRHEMQKPEQLTSKFGVLNVGFMIVTFFIMFMGTFSYLAYGNWLNSTVFESFPSDEALVKTVLIVVCIQVVLTYPLQLYVPVKIIWNGILIKYGPFKHPTIMESFLRTFLILITVAVGELVPIIDLLISLIGSVCSTSLTILLPPFLNIIIRYPKLKTTNEKTVLIVKNVVIMIIAIIIFFSGIISTIRNIIDVLFAD